MKKLKIILFVFTVICFFLVNNSFSQGKFSYHLGPTIPSGNFADDDFDKIWERTAAAGLGLGIGVKYLYPINARGLNLFVGADINLNGLNKDIRNELEDENEDADITFPKYLSLPITGGLNYTVRVDNKVSLFAEGGLAASFLKMTDFVFEEDMEDERYKFELSTNLGYKIGGGIILNDRTKIELAYYGLGKHQLNAEVNYDHETENLDDFKFEVCYTMLTIGFDF